VGRPLARECRGGQRVSARSESSGDASKLTTIRDGSQLEAQPRRICGPSNPQSQSYSPRRLSNLMSDKYYYVK
jgi:hypothetical protein